MLLIPILRRPILHCLSRTERSFETSSSDIVAGLRKGEAAVLIFAPKYIDFNTSIPSRMPHHAII
jgi:hypothetical protein